MTEIMNQIPYFPKAFLTFRIDLLAQPAITVSAKPPWSLNNARIQIESVCQLLDREDGVLHTYVLGASCKSEQVGVDRDMWHQPNADFCPILSQDEFLNLKSWDRNDKGIMFHPPSLGPQPERQSGLVADAFDRVTLDVPMVDGERLDTAASIVESTLNGDILVGRVAFTAQTLYDVTIDFPIKTMNANERDNIYQPDTGPVLFPDFDYPHELLIETFHLAFVAFNQPHWAEFILQVPTPLNDQLSVNHYDRVVGVESHNNIFRVTGVV
ncbi:hypothetical protein KFU94_46665 [Chloroflexi bacterium TSY]|nr:hypothetical protein [Chloroflexi bacterium TSY]